MSAEPTTAEMIAWCEARAMEAAHYDLPQAEIDMALAIAERLRRLEEGR